MAEGLSRKKKVRGGHRSSTKRTIVTLYEAIESTENPDGILTKLEQCRITLNEKRDTLKQLDDEILELVEDTEVDDEIEQADVFRERIQVAIIDATAAVDSRKSKRDQPPEPPTLETDDVSSAVTEPTATSVSAPTSDSPSSTILSSVGDSHTILTSPTTVSSADESHTNVIPSTTVSSAVESHTTSTSIAVTSTVSSALTTVMASIELPRLSTPIFSVPSLYPPAIPSVATISTDHGMMFSSPLRLPPLPPAGHTPIATSIEHVAKVKLPKLSLKRFNGDITQWSTFWDTFQSSIDSNPGLSNIDKFNYLKSLLEGPASEAVSGLKLTAANYTEAVQILKKRFGNKRLIVDKHMENLLSIDAITSHNNLKGLRHLHDMVESQIRGLRSLGVPAASYGSLMSSVLMAKLPQEFRLLVNREVHDEEWNLDGLMQLIDREIDARERASMGTHNLRRTRTDISTAAALLSSGTSQPKCSYCRQNHSSTSCKTVVDVAARKQILRRSGRCFNCLRKNHMSRECRSNGRCSRCGGRHHASICDGSSANNTREAVTQDVASNHQQGEALNLTRVTRPNTEVIATTSAYCGSVRAPVLLQTARALVFKITDPQRRLEARIMFDSGSQRSYITQEFADALSLSPQCSETMLIRTFGSQSEARQVCDVVSLGMVTKDGRSLQFSVLTVPFICEPLTSQPTLYASENYPHLANLELADYANEQDELSVDVLVGSDHYWKLVTGDIVSAEVGPTAVRTRLGWVLAGPVEGISSHTSTNLVVTHTMTTDAYVSQDTDQELDRKLKLFWDLESLGIRPNEATVYTEFETTIRFSGGRYEVSLPWKESHAALPDNYDLSLKRLAGLLKRLRHDSKILLQYDAVIRDQIRRGIVEPIESKTPTHNRIHYLPHHAVLREDKTTTKLRVVYDASSRTHGPSLNDCLYTGPKSGQKIMDILLRFRVHRVAVAADIEKAFLMIAVRDEDRDALRFLWVKDVNDDVPHVTVLRFTRVVFGVSASPFLLNATIKHHMEQYSVQEPDLVSLFMRSIYVDDISAGADDDDSAFQFFTRSKEILARGGFNLRKFVSNSTSLSRRVEQLEGSNEGLTHDTPNVVEEDKSYTKDVLGSKQHSDGEQKILGVKWNFVQDTLIFDLNELANVMNSLKATKRQIVGVTARLYDPLGFMSPVIVKLKMFFQELCASKVEWDEPLSGQLLIKWNSLLSGFKGVVTSIPRCYVWSVTEEASRCSFHGFCDASLGAYAAVVYVKIETPCGITTSFVASKTRVAPVSKQTIPRLELLSALLLANLITTVTDALKDDMPTDSVTCYTDSKVALCWIKGVTKEWKPFVQNRVNTIRRLVPHDQWRFCPGEDNPADLPSRGVSPSDLVGSVMWRYGPQWLTEVEPEGEDELITPEECMKEIRVTSQHVMVVSTDCGGVGNIMDCAQFGTLGKLLRVTAYVLRFCTTLKAKIQRQELRMPATLGASELQAAEALWVKEAQSCLKKVQNFKMWEQQFVLFLEAGVWRCKGRLGNADISYTSKYPALLTREHPLTTMIVEEAHRKVMHNGVKETLTEVRSKYWIVKGRQFVRRVIHRCFICRKLEGHPYSLPPPPPLPEFRVTELPPFSYTGVDFAGPLYVKTQGLVKTRKVWICLYTCCIVRAVHLELVPDMTTDSFLRCFKRFVARRGIPQRMISDNGKTFKAAAKNINMLCRHDRVQELSSSVGVEWSFNLEKAPWSGGIFERMIRAMKRCLKKTIGRANITYDELMTVVTEAEMILNSRPLSYVSTEDIEEPLTPSHLLIGRRLLSPPAVGEESPPEVSQVALSKRVRYLDRIMSHFWKRWRSEYLLELRESHRRNGTTQCMSQQELKEGDVVLLHGDNNSRSFWKLARIEKLLKGSDKQIRGAMIRVPSRSSTTILRRPLKCIYPLEISCQDRSTPKEDELRSDGIKNTEVIEETPVVGDTVTSNRPKRAAAQKAREWMKTMVSQLNNV